MTSVFYGAYNFQNSCSTECHWTHVAQKSINIHANYKCHKINLSGASGVFLSYVILSNHLLLAGVKNRNVIITQRFHAAPDQANRDFFLTAYYNCRYFSLYKREVLGCLLGISPSGRNSCGGNYIAKIEWALWLAEKRAVNTSVTSRCFAVRALISQAQIWKMFWGENSTNLTNLLYLPISSRFFITVSNYPSRSHVYIKLCKHGKRAFSIA